MGDPLPIAFAGAASRSGTDHNANSGVCVDQRFRNLVGNEAWGRLPRLVQRRFARALADGESCVFLGEVAETRVSVFGRLIGRMLLPFGSPLPLRSTRRTPAAVVVTEDHASGGQLWTRIYGRAGHFPQVIHSTKCFAGRTGLEERVGGGFGMALTVHVVDRALVFRSAWYFLRVFGLTVKFPWLLSPGRLEVVHREEREGRFSFTLTVRHPVFGEAIRQVAFFKD